jgi:hypothetical protein
MEVDMRTASLLLIAFLLMPIISNAAPTTEIVEDQHKYGCPGNYPFPEDNLKLLVQDGKAVLAELPFCSSYGKASALIEQDALGANFVLLRYGQGRGTNATSEYLAVYRLGHNLIEYARIPISAPASGFSRWEYKYTVSKPPAGGLIFHLVLETGPKAEWYPAERQRTIEIR